jgi:hypothetical protein
MKILFLTVVLCASIAGCGEAENVRVPNGPVPSPSPTKSPVPDPVLDANVEKWNSAGLKDYDITATLFEGGTRGYAFPVIISVRNGGYVSTKAVEKDNKARMDGYDEYNCVEKMFDVVRSHLADKSPAKVKYNDKYGYPESITYGDPTIVDAWRTFTVKKFEVIDHKSLTKH